ncbi:transcriptional regulator [Pseudomonas sp. CFBP 13711]|uniref:transcriptional regulator n=1 Tax=unclassified Pseudomonas TaxID=196821 RepID=UPI00177CB81E|nr:MULTISPECIES: transcriptional regulator [unclassified Pseudomonas]MBD8705822.1 transcriptional regulator [Pseudomonas sp. CFBP 13711]MBD8710479.1 transcriptional regulator [Pseudomonas sp. CFBP 13715]
MKTRPHDEGMDEHFSIDGEICADLLIEVRRNGEVAELAILLRQLAKAFGQDEGWSLPDAEHKLLSA